MIFDCPSPVAPMAGSGSLPLNSAMTKSPSGLSRSMKRCYLISLDRYWLVPFLEYLFPFSLYP